MGPLILRINQGKQRTALYFWKFQSLKIKANQTAAAYIIVTDMAISNSMLAPTQAEFHKVIAQGAGRWYSACLRITRNRELAEDAVQDALLRAWNKRDQYQGSARLDTWIHQIAVNSALQLLRKVRVGIWEQLDTEIACDSPNPELHHSDLDLENSLCIALTKLSATERLCFVLKHIEQWKLQEIADELETTIGNVKQSVFRAVKKLREYMVMPGREA